jgi:hypothetical protein
MLSLAHATWRDFVINKTTLSKQRKMLPVCEAREEREAWEPRETRPHIQGQDLETNEARYTRFRE